MNMLGRRIFKFGWNNSDGTVGWGIKWVANGGTEYTVKDFDARLNTSVKMRDR